VRGEEGGTGPGPRPEVEDADRSQAHPPHETAGGEAVLPANAHGKDLVDAHHEVPAVDDESMYDNRPGEDKDRHERDMP
jgi:hypothetical protein